MPGSDVAAVRRAIDAEVRGRTLCDLYARNAEQHGLLPALSWEAGGRRRFLSWAEYREAAVDVAAGLAGLGVDRGDVVALMLANRPEHLIGDGGALHASATPVSIAATLAPEQLVHVAGDCGATVAIVEPGEAFERWLAARDALPRLEHLVVVGGEPSAADNVLSWDDLRLRGRAARLADPERFEAAAAQVEPDDPATIVYAPRTTGPPQGVVLTHRNVLWELASIERFVALPAHLRAISSLPLARVDERLFGHYLHLQKAGALSCCPDPARAAEIVRAARPQIFLAGPQEWGEMRARLHRSLTAEGSERARTRAHAAFAAGRKAVRYEQQGIAVPAPLRLRRTMFERSVYGKMRARLGLDECVFAVSATAPLAPEVIEFFSGLGLPVHEAYGLTETTAVMTANRPGGLRIGSAGRALPGVELRLAVDGEIIARGGNIMAGYHGDEAATGEAIDEDGWLHTGDLGTFDADGYLSLVGRKNGGGRADGSAAVDAG